MLFDQFGRPVPAPAPRQIGFITAAPTTPPKPLEGGCLADAVAWKAVEPEYVYVPNEEGLRTNGLACGIRTHEGRLLSPNPVIAGKGPLKPDSGNAKPTNPL